MPLLVYEGTNQQNALPYMLFKSQLDHCRQCKDVVSQHHDSYG